MSDKIIPVECELCGTIAGFVPPCEIRAAVTILNAHLVDCSGEQTILSPEDTAYFERLARENLR